MILQTTTYTSALKSFETEEDFIRFMFIGYDELHRISIEKIDELYARNELLFSEVRLAENGTKIVFTRMWKNEDAYKEYEETSTSVVNMNDFKRDAERRGITKSETFETL